MSKLNNMSAGTPISLDDKKEYLKKASDLWDKLTERQKGRLEGKLEAFEQFALEERTA